jgi:hypothetical protein
MTMARTLRQRGWMILLDVHREWLAWVAAALLPADLHHRWIRRWRNFWDNSDTKRTACPAINHSARPSSAAAP